jgi:hypothetical protein
LEDFEGLLTLVTDPATEGLGERLRKKLRGGR